MRILCEVQACADCEKMYEVPKPYHGNCPHCNSDRIGHLKDSGYNKPRWRVIPGTEDLFDIPDNPKCSDTIECFTDARYIRSYHTIAKSVDALELVSMQFDATLRSMGFTDRSQIWLPGRAQIDANIVTNETKGS